ncbi:unnamed protein product [Phaedon cochleariae]|uniref:Peptidase S1 domain-containing protein n=1 Tax=Phaedon cochleariae TaxID=80249 RepID=A0A9P0GP43_PHACE|nr:unnamed protein product [Phaedon cochleariae]
MLFSHQMISQVKTFNITIEMVGGDIVSLCPNQFVFEPEKSEDDRWYGIIKLKSEFDITGVILQVHFDKSVIEFGNYLGQVDANDDNTQFTIKNEKKRINAHTTENMRIFVIYHPLYDVVPPNLSKIVFNGREICPHFEEQKMKTGLENTLTSIALNISVPKCGIRRPTTTPLITLGQNTRPGDWPWHAAIYWKFGSQRKYNCGGTLISEYHVLTVAHCTTSRTSLNCTTDCTTEPRALEPGNILVILGKYGIYIINGSNEQTIEASKITVHPQYSSRSLFNDISIIHLKRPAQMTNFVRYICLWNDDTSLSSVIGKIGIAVGWGRNHQDNQLSDLLMQAQMPVVDTYTCIYSFPEVFGRFTNNENNFCAGFRNGTSVCNGDSGGGLMFPMRGTSGPNTQWQIRGMVSSTVPKIDNTCDPNHYVIFTDVAKYLGWIHNITKS